MLNEQTTFDLYDDVSNPLDGIEEIMLHQDWAFERSTEDELSVTVSGKLSHYTMTFKWQEEYSAMQFSCSPDITIATNKMDEAAKTVTRINGSLWLGHFDVKFTDGVLLPTFRHTCLFRGMNETSGVGHMEDLIDIALSECERYHLTFDLLSKTTMQNSHDMSLAMMDIAGQS